MTEADVRDVLLGIVAKPEREWASRLEKEFPDDEGMRRQALLWLHAEREGRDVQGAPPTLGDAADERYELSLRLDTGATASVWQAFDRTLGRNVAIKVFHDRNESEALDQVLAEARAASDVISDHVVRVLDVHHGEGRPFIVMELVGEHDPDKREVVLGTAASSCRPRSIDEIARWVMQVARGVHDAHLRNVFHRDLKPHNVLITPITRRARVADFGLAVSGTSVDVVHPAMTLLRRGPSGPVSVRGTPEYMAPEQARGLPLALDPRAAPERGILVGIDVWGLGAIAYDLLCARPPWIARPGDDLSAWEIASSGESPPPLAHARDGERIPPRLRRVIEKAMAIEPAARYSTAAAVAGELQAFLAKRPTTLDRSRVLRLALWCRRNPHLALTALIAVALTALAAGTHATVTRLRGERDALNGEVREQQAEETRLNASVEQARRELRKTLEKLHAERETLTRLEQTLVDDKAAHAMLLEDKEKALRSANTATRQMMQQLDGARRELGVAQEAHAKLRDLADTARRDAERAAKDRDRIRREREAVRTERDTAQREREVVRAERDAAQRERDDAIAEREAAEKGLRALRDELSRLKSQKASEPRARR